MRYGHTAFLAMLSDIAKSKMCKVFVTNSTPNDIEECGFEDIKLQGLKRCQFSGKGETRVFYIYLRKTLSNRSRKKWPFEYERQVETASGPLKDAWERMHKGRVQAKSEGRKLSYNPEIAKMNMVYDECAGWMDGLKQDKKKNKGVSYNDWRPVCSR